VYTKDKASNTLS